MKSGRAVLVFLATACVFAVCLVAANESDSKETNTIVDSEHHSKFVLPKLFDFEKFKTLFAKRYNSVVEEITRKKVYLGRAFRVFIAAIKYKHGLLSHYLAINPMSDWSHKEIRAILIKRETLIAGLKETDPYINWDDEESGSESSGSESGEESDLEEETPVADIEEIKRQLEEVEAHKNEPGYNRIASELDLDGNRRRRRSLEPRELSLDDLMPNPEAESEMKSEPKSVPIMVPSNNPFYEPPELMSYGAEDDDEVTKDLPDEEKGLFQKSGFDFLQSVVKNAVNALSNFQPFGDFHDADEEYMPKWTIKMEEKSQAEKTKSTSGDGTVNEVGGEVIIEKPSDPTIVFKDHTTDGCLPEIQDQGQCGACYVFALMALYEWTYCQATEKRVMFSEQYAIDCGEERTPKIHGCNGGVFTYVSRFVETYGLELRSNYPFREKEESCPYDPDTDAKKMGYMRFNPGKLMGVPLRRMEYRLQYSPMVVNIAIPPGFHEYGGSVHMGETCDEDSGHSMLLIGHGRENGEEYWLFRNSHGVWYGDKGLFKLSKKSDCLFPKFGWMFMGVLTDEIKKKTNRHYEPEPIRQRAIEHIKKQAQI